MEIIFSMLAGILVLISAAGKLMISLRTDYADGWDAYFYLVQVKSLAETGTMHSPDISPVYAFILGFYFTVRDYVLAYKTASAVIGGLFSLSLYFLAQSLLKYSFPEKKRIHVLAVSITVLAFSVFSLSLIFVNSQFPKNMLGFMFFNFFLVFFFKAIPQFKTGKFKSCMANILLCLLFGCAAFITHRFSAGLSVMVLLYAAAVYLLKNRTFSRIAGRKIIIKIPGTKEFHASLLFLFFMSLTAGLAGFSILSFYSPGVFHITDLSRFRNVFQPAFQITPLGFMNILGSGKFPFIWKLELTAVYFLLFVILAAFITVMIFRTASAFRRNEAACKNFNPAALSGLLMFFILFVFPFFKMDAMGPGYRFYAAFLVFSPLLFVFIPGRILKSRLIFILPVSFTLLSFFSAAEFDFSSFNPPYEYYEKITLKSEEILGNRDCELVVAHKALAEIYTFTSGTDALPWKPEARFDTEKVWRICYGADDKMISFYTDAHIGGEIMPLDGKYSIVREDVWRKFLEVLKYDRPDEYLSLQNWMNPYEVRPDFITKKRKYEQ
ncbi:MAG: hypothetical protein JW982_02170 [Spirochaetes bacterium]|nr:hypothetical protein [Spirochaetota bacterium]